MNDRVVFFKALSLLLSLVMVGQLTNTINMPIMANIAEHFHVRPSSVQLLIAAYLLPYGFFQFVWGPLSDYFGRRPTILAGLMIFIAGTSIAFQAQTFNALLAGSFIQGMGIAVAGVMARTIMVDCYRGKELLVANSYVSMCIVLAPLAAPIMGGFLGSHFGWQSTFMFLGVLSIIVLITQTFYFKETRPAKSPETPNLLVGFDSVFKCPSFRFNLFYLVVVMSAVSVIETNMGVLFGEVLKLSPIQTSILFVIPLPAYMLGSYLVSKLKDKVSVNSLIKIGVNINVLAAVMMFIFGMMHIVSIWAIILPASIFFFGSGIIFPTATTKALEQLRLVSGTAGAICGGMQSVGAGLVVWVSSTIPVTTQLPLGGILVVLSIACVWVKSAEKKSESSALETAQTSAF